MPEVTLAQVLQAREDRVRSQRELLKLYKCPIISFTMNIAGPTKTSLLIERAFHAGLDALDIQLPKEAIRFCNDEVSVTGCQAMYAVDLDALRLKKICTDIEDSMPLGRLFDMDVIDRNGIKIDRSTVNGRPRNCLVCGAPGRVCAAGRLHTVSQLQETTHRIIHQHFALTDQQYVGNLAVQSLIDEVNTTPKPGLVDQRNNGSHKDMNLSVFLASAQSLQPYFSQCVRIGQETSNAAIDYTFSLLREAGIRAENTMYHTTGGVNTHKGAIYTMGLLCGSLGRLWTPEQPIPKTEALLSECSRMAKISCLSDSASESGIDNACPAIDRLPEHPGARGEAAAGLPSVYHISLPTYKKALQAGLSSNDAGVIALLHLIAHVEDTNLYRRGGEEGASFAAATAKAMLKNQPYPTMTQIAALDDTFINRNLSPGGCADLLAITYFLWALQS